MVKRKVSNKKVPVSGGMNKNLVVGVVVVLLLVGVFLYFNNQKDVGLMPGMPDDGMPGDGILGDGGVPDTSDEHIVLTAVGTCPFGTKLANVDCNYDLISAHAKIEKAPNWHTSFSCTQTRPGNYPYWEGTVDHCSCEYDDDKPTCEDKGYNDVEGSLKDKCGPTKRSHSISEGHGNMWSRTSKAECETKGSSFCSQYCLGLKPDRIPRYTPDYGKPLICCVPRGGVA